MIGGTLAVSVNGVYVLSGPSKVTFPLLFTYRCVYVVPKKFTGNPTATAPVEPSSF
jgi:hypothetical protein